MPADQTETAVAVQMIMRQAVTERIRCVRLATGQIIYEFWTDGSRVGQIDAESYDAALDEARANMQDEKVPEFGNFASATRVTPEATRAS